MCAPRRIFLGQTDTNFKQQKLLDHSLLERSLIVIQSSDDSDAEEVPPLKYISHASHRGPARNEIMSTMKAATTLSPQDDQPKEIRSGPQASAQARTKEINSH